MAAQGSYQFLGKVEYASTAAEGMTIARRVTPTAGRLDLWTDQSSRDDSYKVGLAVAFKRHDYPQWREHYTRLEPDDKMPSKEAELRAVDFGLRQGKRWLRADDNKLDLYCEVRKVVDRIRDYQPGDGLWGEDACKSIHQTVAEIQQNKHWAEEGIPCVVRFTLVKAHAHRKTGGGDGGYPIMGNCWADYWASVVVDGGQSKSQSQEQVDWDIRQMIEKRQKEDIASLKQEMEEIEAVLAAEKAMSEEQMMNE
ncbi:Cholesterol oxidase [Lasiodiplodia theobromae]|uniref:RNase H type-1 domain-containing protein n=1 Tax=Lasiodiplodia theobromae TaxID=45133 RepID=A0A5N5DQU1_9PEZI|nr:Cholesterol oxidase [Lasiodiplodia theobromae]KAB2580133.1 hypothetical protein DBV05_g1280 [Lasiodiplodia theobromae]KAF4542694.1 Cholesterol oxidase [Lasiodiplodia theobromae]